MIDKEYRWRPDQREGFRHQARPRGRDQYRRLDHWQPVSKQKRDSLLASVHIAAGGRKNCQEVALKQAPPSPIRVHSATRQGLSPGYSRCSSVPPSCFSITLTILHYLLIVASFFFLHAASHPRPSFPPLDDEGSQSRSLDFHRVP